MKDQYERSLHNHFRDLQFIIQNIKCEEFLISVNYYLIISSVIII